MLKKLILIFLVLASVIISLYMSANANHTPITFGTFADYTTPQSSIAEIPVLPTNIAFVGDVMLARNVEKIQMQYGADYIFAALPMLSTSTILVGNFESTIAQKHTQTPNMGMSFSTPTTSISSLVHYGFSYLSLANNHSYDKGGDNFRYTQTVLRANGLATFGDQQISSSTVAYATLQERKVALIGVYAVTGMPDMQKLRQVLAEASEDSVFQVVYVHWGTEYKLVHSAFQETLAHQLIDMGADAVIGHHPHVVQDIQFYKEVPIFYSLGNFVFDQYFNEDVQQGLWVELTFIDDVPVYTLKPVTAHGSYSQPRFMSAYDSDRFLRMLAQRSDTTYAHQIQNSVLTVQ